MIYLITGVPGHGKSLYAVSLLEKFKAEGRPIYSNVEGYQSEGVFPAPADWTTTPAGSIVCYDECQTIFSADGRTGRADRHDIQQMEVHRHTEHDLILVTQSPKLLHPHVRRLVGRHHHLERKFGMNYSRLYTADRLINTESRSELVSVDSEVWTYPKDLFGLYRSASGHNVRRRVDTRLKWAAASVGVLVCVIAVGALKAKTFVTGEYISDATGQAIESNETKKLTAASASKVMVISGCITSDTKCACYSEDGLRADMPYRECVDTAEKPMPHDISPHWNPAGSAGIGGA